MANYTASPEKRAERTDVMGANAVSGFLGIIMAVLEYGSARIAGLKERQLLAAVSVVLGRHWGDVFCPLCVCNILQLQAL